MPSTETPVFPAQLGTATVHGQTVLGDAPATRLVELDVELGDGRRKRVAATQRPDAVGVLPVREHDGDLQVLLCTQPRPAAYVADCIEIVAGKIDAGDDDLDTAQRELAEEAGLAADRWTLLAADLLPAPGYSDEQLSLYLAQGLREVPSRAEDAHISTWWTTLGDAFRAIASGRIRDMKTIIAIYQLAGLQDAVQ